VVTLRLFGLHYGAHDMQLLYHPLVFEALMVCLVVLCFGCLLHPLSLALITSVRLLSPPVAACLHMHHSTHEISTAAGCCCLQPKLLAGGTAVAAFMQGATRHAGLPAEITSICADHFCMLLALSCIHLVVKQLYQQLLRAHIAL
jgi:hypothetical protein